MNKLPKPAQYLLRIDDLCPGMAAEPWRQIVSLIDEFRLRPILGIVPENRDPELEREPGAADEFWEQVRRLEAAGATIGMHGYRHLCRSRGAGLLKLANESEFAGVMEEQQHAWIREGLWILRSNGLCPKLWIAPRHGFDRATLRALRAEGIDLLSDGFARVPFSRADMMWIPQQLWAPVEKRAGLWTICIHPNTATSRRIAALSDFLHSRASRFTSVERVTTEFSEQRLSVSEAVYASLSHLRIRLRRFSKSRMQRFAEMRKGPPSDPESCHS